MTDRLAEADQFTTKAMRRIGRRRLAVRLRVCVDCVQPADDVLGTVHSAGACGRCGKAPCGYGAIVETP
jgi:hypothetical protein